MKAVEVKIPAGRRAAAVDAAGDHAVAVTSDGAVWAWGSNEHGQLGDGTTTARSAPVRVRLPKGQRGVTASAGPDTTIVVTRDGRLFGFGSDRSGQLGRPLGSDRRLPIALNLPAGVRADSVAVGRDHVVVLSRAGDVYEWGRLSGTTAATPARVTLPGPAASVVSGDGHVLAVTQDGHLYGWGANTHGQVGDSSRISRPEPVAVAGVGQVAAVAAGGDRSLAIDRTGRVWAWGDNYRQQNNPGRPAPASDDQLQPTPVDDLGGVVATTGAVGAAQTVLLVKQAPVAAVRLEPSLVTVKPNQHQRYAVTGYDAFHTDVANLTAQAAFQLEGGTCQAGECWTAEPGSHVVQAHTASCDLSARLIVGGADASSQVEPAPQPPLERACVPGSYDAAPPQANTPGPSRRTRSAGVAAGVGLLLAVAAATAAAVLVRRRGVRAAESSSTSTEVAGTDPETPVGASDSVSARTAATSPASVEGAVGHEPEIRHLDADATAAEE